MSKKEEKGQIAKGVISSVGWFVSTIWILFIVSAFFTLMYMSNVIFFRCKLLPFWVVGTSTIIAILGVVTLQIYFYEHVGIMSSLLKKKVDDASGVNKRAPYKTDMPSVGDMENYSLLSGDVNNSINGNGTVKNSSKVVGRVKCFVCWSIRSFCVVIGLLGSLVVLASLGGWIALTIKTDVKRYGNLEFEGLLGTAKLTREPQSRVVHIEAENKHDLYFAQGVYSAQERGWQMEFQRRVGQGRLAELVGEGALKTDKQARIIGFYKAAIRSWNETTGEMRDILNAFCDGVNAYNSKFGGNNVESLLFSATPEPWEGQDVLVWLKMMSWGLSANADFESLRLRILADGVSFDRVNELFPFYPEWAETILNQEEMNIKLTKNETDAIERDHQDNSAAYIPKTEERVPVEQQGDSVYDLDNLLHQFAPRASNNWVVSKEKTATGAPLLSNDPHLKFTSPSIWYLAHLKLVDKDSGKVHNVHGSALAGVPGIVIGGNDNITWGVTNTFADNQDLFVIDEIKAGETYKHTSCANNECQYVKRVEKIQVKGGENVTITVLETLYGPVINDAIGVGIKTPVSLLWQSAGPNDRTAETFIDLNYATNWEEFKLALKKLVAPSQNFIFADKDNIGYYAPGRIPRRVKGHTGNFPVMGNGTFDYPGYIPFEELPHVYNPSKGFMASANNRVTPRGYKYKFSMDWPPPYRYRRISQMIQEFNVNMTVNDMRTIHMDANSSLYHEFSFIFKDPSFRKTINAKHNNQLYVEWLENLIKWNGVEEKAPEATLWETIYGKFLSVTKDETSQLRHLHFINFAYLRNIFNPRVHDKNCRTQSCQEFAVDAFCSSVDDLMNRFSGEIPGWSTVHKSRFAHAILDQSPFACLASREINNIGGSETVNVGKNSHFPDFISNEGVSYRQIIDVSNMTNSQFMTSPGQSGCMLSKSYDNMIRNWRDGNYLTLDFNDVNGDVQLLHKM